MTLDPTRTTTKQNEAAREWRVRWADAKRAVLDYIEALPRKRKEASVITRLFSNAPAKYIFDIAPERLETIQVAIADILADKLAGNWLFDEYVARAYTQGAAQAQATLWPQFKALGITESPLPFSAVAAYQHRMTLLQARIFEEVAWIAKEQAQSVGKILSRAILQGEGAIDTGKLISQLFNKREYIGERLARTEITMALKRARLDEGEAQADMHGLEVKFMHTSAFSPSSRYTHMQRHGRILTSEEIREWYSRDGNAINCFLPNTKVKGRFIAGSKAHYRGKVVKIVTASGRNLTVTPNHHVMTNTGLVAAAKLFKGDYVVANSIKVKNPVGVSALDSDLIDARIDNVFSTLSNIGHSYARRVGAVDFNGDGRLMDKNINVVNIDRVLPCGGDPKLFKALDYFALKHSNLSQFGLSSIKSRLHGIFRPSKSLVSRLGYGLSLFKSGAFVSKKQCLALVSDLKPVLFKVSNNAYPRPAYTLTHCKDGLTRLVSFVQFIGRKFTLNSFAPISRKVGFFGMITNSIRMNTILGSKRLNTIPSNVFLDKIIDVSFIEYDGHVYDLQEVSGLMVANDILTSNCKCSQVEIILNKDGEPLAKGLITRAEKIKEKYAKRIEEAKQ